MDIRLATTGDIDELIRVRQEGTLTAEVRSQERIQR